MNKNITLPQTLDLKEIFKAHGRITGERLLLILSYIYCVGLWKYRMKDVSMQVHWEYLATLGGDYTKNTRHIGSMEVKEDKECDTSFDHLFSAYPKNTRHIGSRSKGEKQYILLLKWATERGLVERDSSYQVGVYSKSLRFCNREEMFSAQQVYTLTSKNAIKAYNNFTDERRKQFMEKGDVYDKIYRSVTGLYYDAAKAYEYITKLPATEQSKMLFFNTWLKNGYECWKVDEQGRVYTAPVITPRVLRRFFSYDGKPMFVVDVSNCQPLLHALLYTTESIEKENYLALVETDNFYNFLNQHLSRPCDLCDEIQKTAFKKRVFGEIFYSREDKKPTDLTRVFADNFPILWEAIRSCKKPNSRLLAKEMQAVEAEIMVKEVVGVVKGADFPVVTIHDAIMTTADGVAPITQAIRNVFNTIYLTPKVKIKEL